MNFFQKIQCLSLPLILMYYFINCQKIPNPRSQQTSAQIDTKLYFFGGDLSYNDTLNSHDANITNEVWYLDLSRSFNTTALPWNKDVEMPVGHILGAPCVSPIDKSIFFIGGRMFVPNTANISLYSSIIYLFNPIISQWTTPNIVGFNVSFTRRNEIQPVIDVNGKIYIFGGSRYDDDDNDKFDIYNDMNIFDTNTMNWSTLPTSNNVPTSRICYTATLLPSGIILYIGGDDNHSSVSMNEIPAFNTKTYFWSTIKAGGAFIEGRLGHSAVLTKHENIIIYGGMFYNTTGTQAVPYIAELNTNTWIWSIPNVSKTNAPPSLSFHSAAIYGDYMFIAFGQTAVISPARINLINNVYILDTINYNWVTTFNQNKSIPKEKPTLNDYINSALITGISIGVGIIVLGLLIFGFLIFKK
ncbi:hypothetical protein C2G38_2062275 [Gigaspora rosea]|uniref:Attractin/MKLN-like beta-propeller domain-containing protein n=1 Tax=Gigaspora rosea TaxID=44941 RepID=A0A397W138_9GLOM|nr:hypothetical protein C2G38_2062275 [Gigaspora rosea]